jgi:uncharacterized phage-associated protein
MRIVRVPSRSVACNLTCAVNECCDAILPIFLCLLLVFLGDAEALSFWTYSDGTQMNIGGQLTTVLRCMVMIAQSSPTAAEAQSPFAIANYFIRKSAETKVPLTPMKLIKLVYIAHGWYLALTGKPLIREPIEAWKFGPVIESLYHAFKRYGNSAIPLEAATQAALKDEDRTVRQVLDKVWDSYAKFTASQLGTLTHQANTPWSEVFDPNELYTVIPNDVIKEHYKEIINATRKPNYGRAVASSTG